MKHSLLIILLLYSVVGFSQEKEPPEVLKADSTWFKEIIKFPLGFAQEIKYEGYEELRFAPGFTKSDDPELWSYVWAWVIENTQGIATQELETNLHYYFDGLLGLDPKYNKDKPQQTLAVLVENKSIDGIITYTGKLKTTDTRYTKKSLILNINGEHHYCEASNKSIVIFRLSPQAFGHDTWRKLDNVKLLEAFCNH